MLLLPELVENKIKWYYWDQMVAKGFATLHLVGLGGGQIDSFPTIELLEILHPGISQSLKRGDIIEDQDDTNIGYRSDGSYMIDVIDDKLEIVSREFSYDDYGSPNFTFEGVSHFPLNYWDPEKMKHVNWLLNDCSSEFYWHGDSIVPVAIYPEKIGITLSELQEDRKIDHQYYHVWRFRGKNHLILYCSLQEQKERLADLDCLIGFYVHLIDDKLRKVMEKFNVTQDCLISLDE